MKIAMIDPSLFTWPYDKALIDGLQAHGHKVKFYTKFLSQGEQGKGSEGLTEFFYWGLQFEPVKNLPHPLFLGLKGISHIFSMAVLWFVLLREKPDVIHFQWVPLPVVDRFFVPLFQKIAPVVLTVHDSSPFNGNPKSKIQGMGSTQVMKLFDKLIVHTKNAVQVVKSYGVNESKIIQIAHGVLGVDSIKTVAAAKTSSNQQEGAPVTVLLFGHLKPYKGADILIEAFAKMSNEAREKTLLKVVGKPQMDVQPLFDRAKDLDVDKYIQWDLRFIGDDEIESVFSNADITAMPYREIDASGVLMVALSIGKPIVASRIGLFKELLNDGEHGYLIEQEDANALADALEKLVCDAALRQEMGRNVIALGQSIPSWNDIALTTQKAYESIAA